MAKSNLDALMSVAIDIGKDTFHVVGLDIDAQQVMRKQIKRLAPVATFEGLPRCIVGSGLAEIQFGPAAKQVGF